MARSRFIYHLLALAVVAVWGVTFVCTKELIRAGLQPAEIFAIRFTLAYAGIWVISLIPGFPAPSFAGSDRRISPNPHPRRCGFFAYQDLKRKSNNRYTFLKSGSYVINY